MNRVIVYEDKQGVDHYFVEGKSYDIAPPEEYTAKQIYANLTDAIKDSDQYQSEHYSDGECLDYVLDVIKQIEGVL